MPERFIELPEAPTDPIMAANASWPAFKAEHPGAVNTTIGVLLHPETGKPWQPVAVSDARFQALVEGIEDSDNGYQSQVGYKPFLTKAGELILGDEGYSSRAEEVLAYQTLGGTNALSLAKLTLSTLIKKNTDGTIPLVLDAGWPNHPNIFSDPFRINTYPHIHPENGRYNHQAALDAIDRTPDNSVLLLQSAGYNDDGADRTNQQWDEILDAAGDKDSTVVLDSAYLGLADGFEDDRYAIEESIKRGLLTFVCVSASKNMGLYNGRVGALYIANAESHLGDVGSRRLHQAVAKIVRGTISSAPLVDAKGAAMALGNEQYYQELDEARGRLTANRVAFAEIVGDEFPSVASGKGLFTKLLVEGFTEQQQTFLASEGVLALPNSRINLGGMRLDQVERVGSTVVRALQLT